MDTDLLVVGAGVIGLAIAEKAASEGLSVILAEKEDGFGRGVSSRSSEVIHAGIYYTTGSLKAKLSLRGRDMLYEYCRKNNVRHKKIGKLFVSSDKDSIGKLESTLEQAKKNGIKEFKELDKSGVKRLEPELKAYAGLLFYDSGIIDSHGLMSSLLHLGEYKGVIFAPNSPVIDAKYMKNGWKVFIGGREPFDVKCRAVVNSAGLFAIDLCKKVFPDRKIPKLYPTKGSYIRFSGENPLRHIVYPALKPGEVIERVDATPDLNGSLRFGPNVCDLLSPDDFTVKKNVVDSMFPSIKKYLPNIDVSKLHPDCSGIRPKIYGPGMKVEDFRFDFSKDQRWLDLFGIESPGLTASLAIGEYVYRIIMDKGLF